jgi:hypothetical protein
MHCLSVLIYVCMYVYARACACAGCVRFVQHRWRGSHAFFDENVAGVRVFFRSWPIPFMLVSCKLRASCVVDLARVYAEKLHVGDQVIKIDGEDVVGANPEDIIDKLNGAPSTKVSIEVLRNADIVA